MSTGKRVAPAMDPEDKLQRQDEAYRLHCRGLTIRAIAAEMRLDPTQVARAIKQAQQRIREQKGDDHLADLADRITEAAWQDVADSWRVSSIEPVETTEEDPVTGGLTKVVVLAPDYKALAAERGNRVKLLGTVMRATGLDPARMAELDLRRELFGLKKRTADAAERQAAAAEGLLARWSEWDCGTPSDPDAE